MAMRVMALVLAAWLASPPPAGATALTVERLDLGEGLDQQAYNLQEQGELRVFARSARRFERSQLFMQRRVTGQWQPAQPLPFGDPRWRDSGPHLSAQARVLTFVSDRGLPEGPTRDELDLYESQWQDGRWSEPRRLPEPWQSAGYELGPERYGDTFYLASTRPGGPGKLAIYRADMPSGAPQPLPSPINDSAQNSDFTLSPDGRYALWWSDRAGPQGGGADLYLAERLGDGFGPAIRLPPPVNGPGLEFTPSVSADGQWLYFASTRDDAQKLSHVYRVAWPQLLAQLGAAATVHSQAALDGAVSALWRAIGHAPGQASDVEALARLLHPEARVFAQVLRSSSVQVRASTTPQFLADLARPGGSGLHECEVERQQRRFGGHAQVYSVVQTRHDPAQQVVTYSGVNSMHWQLGPQGWQLLALHYALETPGLSLPAVATPCLG
jgi:WD40-like Beta Propeller Repeat/Domain of unknown function (DUF4440)